jgi:hypothetical protein
MLSPFRISIFGAAFNLLGVLGNPLAQSWTPRFNKVGTGTFEVSREDPMLPFLLARGARVRVTYKGEHLISGPVLYPSGSFEATGTITFQVEDDFRMLSNTLAWVRPFAGLRSSGALNPGDLDDSAQAWKQAEPSPGAWTGTSRGQSKYMLWPDGSGLSGGVQVDYSESAIKFLISANLISRLHRAVTVSTDLERGGDARAADMLPRVRFQPINDVLSELMEWSGLGVKLTHDGTSTTVTAEVWEPTTFPQVLTVESGIIQSGTWSTQNPTATRIVVGGPGESAARAFWGVNNTSLETEYTDIIEVFRDATGATLIWPDDLAEKFKVAKYFLLRDDVEAGQKTEFTSYLNEAGSKGLAAGVPTSGLSLTLSETDTFFFGSGGFSVGDVVNVADGEVAFTDRITECELSESISEGVVVTPRVGGRLDDPDQIIADAIAQLAAAQRRISTSK